MKDGFNYFFAKGLQFLLYREKGISVRISSGYHIGASTSSTVHGFTLVETLVAILALGISIGTLTLLTARTVIQSREAEARVQAEMLAVEGLELVYSRYMSNLMASPSTDPFDNSNLSPCLGAPSSPQYCKPTFGDIVSGASFTGDTTLGQSRMYLATSGNYPLFSYSTGGTATKFYRAVYVKNNTNSDGGKTIRSIVWYDGNVPSSFNSQQKKVVMTRELRPWYTPQTP